MRKYKEQVTRGIRAIEEFSYKSLWDIDIDKLYMRSCSRCILGQLYGDYYAGLCELKPCHATNYMYIQNMWAIKHGFLLPYVNDRKEYELLNNEWKSN